MITDEDGEPTQAHQQYKPYGEKLPNTQADSVKNEVGYTGKLHDEDIGLTYMNARYYDPFVGRFMAMDAVDYLEGGADYFNRYMYANNNPYKYIDPTGKDFSVGYVGQKNVQLMTQEQVDDNVSAWANGGLFFGSLLALYASGPFAPLAELALWSGSEGEVPLALRGAGVTKSATEIAREGGKHFGQLKQFLKQTPEQLQKTIRSFDKQIAKHEVWVKDPASKVKNFSELSTEHQQNLLHHWQQDIARHQELKSIAQDVLMGL